MAQLLRLACTDALYRTSRLQQLLQGTSEPSYWTQLQASGPVKAEEAGRVGRAGPAAWERLEHLLKLQVFLLVQAHGVLQSLWVCRAAAAAVTRACLGRRRAATQQPGPQPHLLTAVLGPAAPAAFVATAAAATLQMQQADSTRQPNQHSFDPPRPNYTERRAISEVEPPSPVLRGLAPVSSAQHDEFAVVFSAKYDFVGRSESAPIMRQQQQLQDVGRPPSVPVEPIAEEREFTLQQQQQHTGRGQHFHRLAAVSVLLLVQLNEQFVLRTLCNQEVLGSNPREGSLSQQQQWQSSGDPVQSVRCLEDLDSVLVSRDPLPNQHSYREGGSSCTVYDGLLPMQGGQKVLVVALSQLFAPDSKAAPDLPPRRREVREQVQLQVSSLNLDKDMTKARVAQQLKQQQLEWAEAAPTEVASAEAAPTKAAPVRAQPPEVSPSSTAPAEASPPKAARSEAALAQAVASEAAHSEAAPAKLFMASEHLGLANASQAGSAHAVHFLHPVLMRLQGANLLAGSISTASASSSSSSSPPQVLPLLAPIHCMCSDPPLFVLPKPKGGTLDQWIADTAGGLSQPDKAVVNSFTLAWVQRVSWPVGLLVLSDVAAALCALHQQQPAVVLGGMHAAAVHLPQPLPDAASAQQQPLGGPSGARVSQLSLVALLSQLAPLSSCHPFLAAPETLLASGPASPAADVYGFGVLMFQLATGWLPQQYTAGTDEQIAAVMWCRDMVAQEGSTSPLAAVQALAKLPVDGGYFLPLPTGEWTPYGRHLPSVAALLQLPPGYVVLMEQCLQRVAPARPCAHELSARLADMITRPPGKPLGSEWGP